MPDAPPPTAENTLESALERLEAIVRRIETDELELDESLRLFEEGVSLLRFAEEVLTGAETKVQQLVEEDGGFVLEPLPDQE